MNRIFITLVATLLCLSCRVSKEVKISFSNKANIKIDGFFDEEDWNNLKPIELEPNIHLYFLQDNEYLYIGIYNDEKVKRYVDLYMTNDSIGTVNLHASMQLGERQLTDNWDDTNPAWEWGNNIDWTANKVEFTKEGKKASLGESFKEYNGHEFKIAKRRVKIKHVLIRLEIKDFDGHAKELVFPPNSERYETKDWLKIKLR